MSNGVLLGNLLDERMKDKGLSLRSVSKQVGISHTTVNRLLEGKSVDVDTIVAVSNWLGIPPAVAINSMGDQEETLASQIALVIESNQALKDVFQEAISQIIEGKIPTKIIEDIASYAAYRIEVGYGTIAEPDDPLHDLEW